MIGKRLNSRSFRTFLSEKEKMSIGTIRTGRHKLREGYASGSTISVRMWAVRPRLLCVLPDPACPLRDHTQPDLRLRDQVGGRDLPPRRRQVFIRLHRVPAQSLD